MLTGPCPALHDAHSAIREANKEIRVVIGCPGQHGPTAWKFVPAPTPVRPEAAPAPVRPEGAASAAAQANGLGIRSDKTQSPEGAILSGPGPSITPLRPVRRSTSRRTQTRRQAVAPGFSSANLHRKPRTVQPPLQPPTHRKPHLCPHARTPIRVNSGIRSQGRIGFPPHRHRILPVSPTKTKAAQW